MSNARKLADNLPTEGQLGNRNLIINGAMTVAQRGTSSTSDGYQTADRWQPSWHASQTITQSQETLSSGDPYDEGFKKFLRMTQGAANSAATDYIQISQRIEGLNVASSGWQFKSSSSYITASFWARSSLAGEYQIYAQTRASTDKYYFKKFNLVANTWTKITCSIAGDSALNIDFDNTSGFEFRIVPYYGTDYTGNRSADEGTWTDYNASELDDFPQNWTASSGATFDVTGVQLEVGPQSTPFEYEPYETTLRKCQRYYQILGQEYNPPAASPDSYSRVFGYYNTQMRANPTFTNVGGSGTLQDATVHRVYIYSYNSGSSIGTGSNVDAEL